MRSAINNNGCKDSPPPPPPSLYGATPSLLRTHVHGPYTCEIRHLSSILETDTFLYTVRTGFYISYEGQSCLIIIVWLIGTPRVLWIMHFIGNLVVRFVNFKISGREGLISTRSMRVDIRA